VLPAVACLLLAAAPARASDAPLGVRSDGLFRTLFLDPILADARPRPGPALDVRWSGSNTWSTPTRVLRGDQVAEVSADQQTDALTISGRAPWSALAGGPPWLARGSSALEWRLTQSWGGWSDGLVSTFHRTIDVFDFDRRRFPADAVRVRLGAPGAPPAIDVATPRLVPGDLVLRSAFALARGGGAAAGAGDGWTVALRLDVKAPTGPLALGGGSGGWDAAAGIAASAEVLPWLTVHGLAALGAWSDLPGSSPLRVRRWHPSGELSLVARRGRWAFLLEDRVSGAVFEGGWRYDGTDARRRGSAYAALFLPLNQLSVGIRRGPVTVWVSEDVTPGTADRRNPFYYLSNAPDVTLGVAVTLAR
jgi:hypothetical protein